MNKSTAMLLTLLLVLGAIVFLVLPSEEERMTSDSRPPVSFSVDSASVTGISIERPGKTLSVEKVGGVWTMTSDGDRRADPAAVGQVIGGLSRFRTGSLISDNPAKQGLFQVDSTGSLVTLTDREGNSTSIIIGKMGPSFSEVYFRMPGSSEVYLGTGITTWTLNRDPSEWRDRTVFASPAEALTRVKIVSAGRSQEFEKDSSGWMSGGQKVSTETMNPILTTLAGIRADDFIDSTVDFGTAPSTVEISGPASAKLNFYRLKSDTNKYAVVSSASPQTFIVGKHVASELFKSVGEPRAVSDPVVRRTASSGSPAATPRKPARTTTTPVESPPVTRRADPPPVTRDAVKTPVTGNPAAGTAAGAKTERAAETGAVNPFKQRPAGEQRPATEAVTPPAVKNQTTTPPARDPVATTPRDRTPVKVQPPESAPSKTPAKGGDDEGELTVHVVKKGETMTTIAKEYGVTVEQILKWNLLTSISVRPGQELYIFVRK